MDTITDIRKDKIVKRKQIAFDILPEIHKQVKMLALMRNISMNIWMKRAIINQIKKETREE